MFRQFGFALLLSCGSRAFRVVDCFTMARDPTCWLAGTVRVSTRRTHALEQMVHNASVQLQHKQVESQMNRIIDAFNGPKVVTNQCSVGSPLQVFDLEVMREDGRSDYLQERSRRMDHSVCSRTKSKVFTGSVC